MNDDPPAYTPSSARDVYTLAPDGRPPEQQPAWRHDFPIDWQQDQYVARRDFAKFMVLTSCAFAVGQVCIGVQSFARRGDVKLPLQRIAALEDVPVGSSMIFNYPTPVDPCLLIRPEKDVLLAYSQRRTHLSCAVIPRVKENCIHCPCHNGYFDLRSGRPIAGPPRRPLPRILVEVKQGVVFATGIERSTI